MKRTLLFLLLMIAGFQSVIYTQFNVDANLLLYLNFDENDIVANEQGIGFYNHVVAAGEGKFSKAAIFDGSAYIAMYPIPSYDPRANSVSFSFWMKTALKTGEDILVYNHMEDPTGVDSEGRLAVALRFDDKFGSDIGWVGGNLESDPGTGNTPGKVSDDAWHHVVVTFLPNGTGINIYIDRNLVDEISTGGSFGEFLAGDSWDFTGFNLFLGGGCMDYPGAELGWAPAFTGSLDEFRMFQTSAPLTPEEVVVLYNYKPLVSGINNSTNSNSITVYPNPATDFINIQTAGNDISVDIRNGAGQTVRKSKNERQIDITSLKPGLYLVKVNDGINSLSHKVVVK